MTLRHLEIFLSVCDHKNMTQAARDLYLSQPSVSQAISNLEVEYGVKLFERLNHRLYLTASGERLQSYARHILNLSEQAKKELSGQRQAGSLRIGASLTTGTYLLPGVVSVFYKKMPNVEVFTLVDNTNVIEKWILEDRIDLGLVEGPVSSTDIVKRNIQDDRLVVICAPGHPLSQHKKISATDLSDGKFIIRESGSGTRAIFETAMRDAGIPWKIAGIYNNTESIKHAVRSNLGLAVVSWISIEEEIKLGQVIPLEIQDLKLMRKFNLIYHRQKFFTKAMQVLVDSF